MSKKILTLTTKSYYVNPVIRDTVYDIAWEVGFKYDAMISPVLAGKAEFVRMTGAPFFNNVKQNGRIL